MSQEIHAETVVVEKPLAELLIALPIVVFDSAVIALVVSGLAYGFIDPVSFPIALAIGALTFAVSMVIALSFYWQRYGSRSVRVVGDCLVISNGRKELFSKALIEIKSVGVAKPDVYSVLGLLSRLPPEWPTLNFADVVVTSHDLWANPETFALLISRNSTAQEVHAHLKRLIPELVSDELT